MGPVPRTIRGTHTVRSALVVVLVLATSVVMGGGTANAAPTPVGLGTATGFALRADDSVTNTGVPATQITGDLGLSPGTSYTGFTCAANIVPPSTVYQVPAGTGPAGCTTTDGTFMTTVQGDARAAFVNTFSLSGATAIPPSLGGQTLVAGLYSFGAFATNIAGTLTLDAQGDPNAVWIFQASSSLITSTGSTVAFSNLPPGVSAAQLACNVFWSVGTDSTIGDATINGAMFVGTILASNTITVGSQATVIGRLLAGNAAGTGGAITLISDTITRPPGCATLPAGTGGGPAAGPPTTAAPPATPVLSPPVFTG